MFRKTITFPEKCLVQLLFLLAASAGLQKAIAQIDVSQRASLPAAVQIEKSLTAREIVTKAHEAAGGDRFVNPKSLYLNGYNIIRSGDTEVVWDKYEMWRVFGQRKDDAHRASGKVRIEAWSDSELALLLAYDGERSYNKDGQMLDQDASTIWSNSFGFGAIRNALDEGWEQNRSADRLIDGAPAYVVLLKDPSGGETLFGIRQEDFAIVYVGFNTPRGWHERRYSHFFEKPGVNWKQAGRVRLFYNGQKSNEAVWMDFEIDKHIPDSMFIVEKAPLEPSF